MKSLSEYTKILRDIATNLNLQGESVEMITQMLANALYISEVEHVAYSQEASLERATKDNSKIQHCVNQMYSVYRGANPRVIINFKATKLFTFKPHQEIIKSNNYKVYYLGYFNENTETIQYSDLTIYPDTTKTIIGLMAKEIVTDEWTVGSKNLYYRSIPESNLSGDLYLDINGERSEVTRIFSDHLKKDIPFDLTLPGYGLRLYYPSSLSGVYNTNYSISIYRSMSLSDILESERKALKMTGSVITSFHDSNNNRSWILEALGTEETYPGIIFIPDTPKDSIDTIHLKANRERYSGTYLATNSDLSWILQEYYPSKIRRQGVTYRFESPLSTSTETLTSSKNLTLKGMFLKYSDLKNSLKDWILGEDEYLPSGVLKFRYQKTKKAVGSNSSYEILPSVSVIPVRSSNTGINNYLASTVYEIRFRVLKITEGQTEVLTTGDELVNNGLSMSYRFPDSMSSSVKFGGGSLVISDIDSRVKSTSDHPLEVTLSSGKNILDSEIIPFTYIPVTLEKVEIKGDPEDPNKVTESYFSVTEEGPGDYYTLDLQDDTVYLKTDNEGKVIEPTETAVTLFYNGKVVSGVTYSLIPSSDIEATINSETGVISIKGMSGDILTGNLIVKARYNGISFQSLLVCRKTITNYNDKGISFIIYSDLEGESYPISKLVALSDIQEASIEIPKGKYKSLSIKTSGDITFDSAIYVYTWEVLRNLISVTKQTTPTLCLYYIPYSDSNLLSKDEISKFIKENKSYYITQDIKISEGRPIIAKFDISLDLYRNTSLDTTILEILQRYGYLFNIDFEEGSSSFSEIRSLITKISEVRNVDGIKITYLNSSTREEIPYSEIKNSKIPVYYIVECVISSIVRS